MEESQCSQSSAAQEPCAGNLRKSYTGIITESLDVEALWYNLDDKLRVSFSHTHLDQTTQRGIYIGTKMTIKNAHIALDDKHNAWLCCCARSTVKIEEPAQLQTDVKVKRAMRQGAGYSDLLSKYSVPWKDFQILVRAHSKLIQKFVPKTISFCPVTWSIGCVAPDISSVWSSRNLQDESKWRDHKCPILAEGKLQPVTVSTINEVLKLARTSLTSERTEISSDVIECGRNWKHVIYIMNEKALSEKLILVGFVRSNKSTSRMQLLDQTGGIDCVISQASHHDHVCSEQCDQFLAGTKRAKITCPVLRPWHSGCLLRITQFKLHCETFTSSVDDPKSSGYSEKIYVQFDLRDAEFIHKVNNSSMPINSEVGLVTTGSDCEAKSSKQSSRSSKARGGECHCHISQLIYLLDVDTPRIRSRLNDRPKLSFYAKTVFIGGLRSSQCDRCLDNQRFYETSPQQHPSHLADAKPKVVPHRAGAYSRDHRHVTLCYQGDNVRWHRMLHVGRPYRIVAHNHKDGKVFQSTFGHEKLRKAVETSQTQQFINLPSGVEVVHVRNGSQTGNETAPLGTIHYLSAEENAHLGDVLQFLGSNISMGEPTTDLNVLDQGFDQKLFNVVGVVLSKRLHQTFSQDGEPVSRKLPIRKENRKLGVSTPMNLPIEVVLSGLDGNGDVRIIIDVTNICFPLCLVPGMVVRISKLESRFTKRDSLVCHFTVASRVQLLGHHSTIASAETKTSVKDSKPESSTNRTFCYLHDVWTQLDDVFQSICDVTKVTKVILTSTCPLCGSLVRDGRCQGAKCLEETDGQVTWKLSCLVEDGTGSAAIDTGKREHIAKFLSLSSAQMDAVEGHARRQGHVEYDHNVRDASDSLTTMLKVLCESPIVRRHVHLTARKFRTFYTSNRQKVKDLNSVPLSEFPKKSVDIEGKTIETHNMPWLQLECISVEEVNFLLLSSKLLAG